MTMPDPERVQPVDLPRGTFSFVNAKWPAGTDDNTPEFWTRDPKNPRVRVDAKDGLQVADHPFSFPCHVCGRVVSSAVDVVAMNDADLLVCDRLHPGEE